MDKQGQSKHIMKKILMVGAIIFAFILGGLFILMLTGDDEYTETDYATDVYEDGYDGESEEDMYTNGLGTAGINLDIEGLRDHYIDTSSAESAVMMVYMIGSNLESESGAATADLMEMANATIGEQLKIVVETGGASAWMNDMVSADVNQIWEIANGEFNYICDTGNDSMTSIAPLQDFIGWTAENYPADRYMLVLWDHGGGTMGGFGWDEVNDNGGFSLQTLTQAIDQAGVNFDIIGFDACLMATIETGYCLEPYADYLLASEEIEPGDGWYYTDFLTKWADDISMDSVELGQAIIDDYAYYYGNDSVTLSISDLREIPFVYQQLTAFLTEEQDQIEVDNHNFQTISMARSNAREYADCEFDQIDIMDLVSQTENKEAKTNLQEAIQSCVKYRNNSSLTGSNGLAMYFPYRMLDSYSKTSEILKNIDCGDALPFYDYFLSIMASGQQRSRSTGAPRQTEQDNYANENWYQDFQTDFDFGEDYSELYLEETEDGFIVDLPDETWEQITDMQLAVMMEYQDGYLDLGNDNIINTNDDGDAIIDFDGTWISINDVPVAFYADKTYENEKGTIFSGSVYAVLNGNKDIELVLEWDPLTDEIAASEDYELKGYVKGYREVNEQTTTMEKGLHTLKKGDTITIQYDYYDADGNYISTETPMDPITISTQDALTVSYADISDKNVMFWGTLFDIYQQEIYTETLEYTE